MNDFREDPGVGAFSENLAEDARKLFPNFLPVLVRWSSLIATRFPHLLDYSDSSIELLELFFEEAHQGLLKEAPPAEKLHRWSHLFGAYIGECFRRNHGGSWGLTGAPGQELVALRDAASGYVCWPWLRVRNRLLTGDTDEVVSYYQFLVKASAESRSPAKPPPLPKLPPPLPPGP